MRWLFLSLLALPLASFGTQCIPQRTTLQEDYQEADAIFVGLVTGCGDSNEVPRGTHCESATYTVQTIEVLKDSEPSRDHGGLFPSDNVMGCGLILAIGAEILFFVDENGHNFGPSKWLNTNRAFDNRIINDSQERLRVLRDFRDGRIGDLAEPWHFMDLGISCRLIHRFHPVGLEFTFVYSQSAKQGGPISLEEVQGLDGKIRFRAVPGNPNLPPIVTTIIEGPPPTPDAINLAVVITDHEPSSATLTVGDKSWSLATRVATSTLGIRNIFAVRQQRADWRFRQRSPPGAENPVRYRRNRGSNEPR